MGTPDTRRHTCCKKLSLEGGAAFLADVSDEDMSLLAAARRREETKRGREELTRVMQRLI